VKLVPVSTKARIAASVAVVCVVGLAVAGVLSSGRHGGSPKASPSGVPRVTIPSAGGGPAVPAEGAYLGAWVTPTPLTQDGRVSAVRDFESSIGARLAITHVFKKGQDPIGTDSDRAFVAGGSHLLISWAGTDTKAMASGSVDAQIVQSAKEVAALGAPVFFEPRWEMDRPNLSSVVHSGADFIAAWDHVRAVFKAQGVTNVSWVWCPTAAGFETGVAQQYYPGDAQVDWVCADVYPETPWKSGDYEPFPQLAKAAVAWAAQHPTKPMMIGEFGDSLDYGDRRAAWLSEAFDYIKAHPQIRAVVYFNQSDPTRNTYQQWGLTGDDPVLKVFADAFTGGYFRGLKQ
jgi:hypothetical protein